MLCFFSLFRPDFVNVAVYRYYFLVFVLFLQLATRVFSQYINK
jgi:hypothetical protein